MTAKQVLLIMPLMSYFILLGWLLYRLHIQRPESPNIRTEALGTHALGRTAVMMTLVATVLGPADTLALADQGRKFGFFFVIFPLFAALQHFITGTFFADKINNEANSCVTVGDIIGKYFSKSSQILAGLFTVLQALAFTGILCLAGGQILEAFFGFPVAIGIVTTAVFVGFYTAFGGMNAVVGTDYYQFRILMVVGGIAVISACILLVSKGEGTPTIWWKPDWNEYNGQTVIATATAYFLGEALLPVYAVRGLISASPEAAKSAFRWTAGVVAAWYLCMTLIGVASQHMQGSPSETQHAFVDVLTALWSNPMLSALFAGLALVALFGLIHSTLDSILNAGAASLVRDVIVRLLPVPEVEQRRYVQTSVLLIAVFGTIFSVVSDSLIEILLIGYTIWVPTMVFPLAYALLKGSQIRSRHSAMVGILSGVAAYYLGTQLGLWWLPPILMGFLGNAVGFLLSEWRGARMPQEVHPAPTAE